MTTTESTTPAPQPGTNVIQSKLTAEQVLLRLLDAIRGSDSIHDFTPEYLSKAMKIGGVGLMSGTHGYTFAGQMTNNWLYSLDLTSDRETLAPYFALNFLTDKNNSSPDAKETCQADFERFARALERMGFSRAQNHAEHGQHVSDTFSKPTMIVQAYSGTRKNDASLGEISHLCVDSIIVR